MAKCNNRTGFTLIELMIVLGILVLLGTVAVVVYPQVKNKMDRDAAQALVDQASSAIELYKAAVGVYPETEQGFNALINPPDDEKLKAKWVSGLLKNNEIPVDPWGSPLQYEKVTDTGAGTGPTFHVWSNGPDEQSGTDDDIRSWKVAQ